MSEPTTATVQTLHEPKDTRRYKRLEAGDELLLREYILLDDLERCVALVDRLVREAFGNGLAAGFDEANGMWNRAHQDRRVVLVSRRP